MNQKERPLAAKLVADIQLPNMFRARQIFPRSRIPAEEIPGVVHDRLAREEIASRVRPGMRIAITAGSRGIANIGLIIKTVADFCRERGARPFIVPAMGSHGGATAEGQLAVLRELGITEAYCGCPIVSSMDVVCIGKNDEGTDVYIDKNAAGADGIILCCRIKPHTAFRGPYESGMMKMMAIGLGKQYGAEVCHAAGYQNMAKNVPLFGRAVLRGAPVLFAVPVIENAFDETCRIEAVPAEDIEAREPQLLKDAFARMSRLWIDACDVLVVDQIGKNFSGDGMDPNITGTFCNAYASGGIRAQRVAVLNLSPETRGCGIGVGQAHVTTARVFRQLDLNSMYPNVITCTELRGAYIPIVMESDRECIQCCVSTCTEIDKRNPRIVRIPNTAHIEHVLLSQAYYQEIRDNAYYRGKLEIESQPQPWAFDENGDLPMEGGSLIF